MDLTDPRLKVARPPYPPRLAIALCWSSKPPMHPNSTDTSRERKPGKRAERERSESLISPPVRTQVWGQALVPLSLSRSKATGPVTSPTYSFIHLTITRGALRQSGLAGPPPQSWKSSAPGAALRCPRPRPAAASSAHQNPNPAFAARERPRPPPCQPRVPRPPPRLAASDLLDS
jgi:hypothetical protein